jgi:DNA-binding GntR family transcriptional regulator
LAKELSLYVSKSDLVTDQLRELITRGELKPGDLLRQRELAERFGVSPTPVREALRRLESEGLVSSDVHRGSIVAEVAIEEVEANYQIRAALESLAVSWAAAKATGEDLDDIAVLHQRLAAADRGDREQRVDLNRQFHFRIYEAAGSPLLLSVTRILWLSIPRGAPSLAQRPHRESVSQHAEILKALRSRDGKRAAELTAQHILGALKTIQPEVSLRVSRRERIS